jgi:adenylyltransferase/sulfurtransferase
VIGVLPGIIGMYQAMEVIKIITGIGTVLTNKILMLDLLQNVNHSISIERNKEAVTVSKSRIKDLNKANTTAKIIDITGADLIDTIYQNPDLLIIDIQDKPSYKKLAGKVVSHIPFRVFLDGVKEIPTNQPVLVFCAHGINSQWATAVLKDKKIEKIYHLVGGISAI